MLPNLFKNPTLVCALRSIDGGGIHFVSVEPFTPLTGVIIIEIGKQVMFTVICHDNSYPNWTFFWMIPPQELVVDSQSNEGMADYRYRKIRSQAHPSVHYPRRWLIQSCQNQFRFHRYCCLTRHREVAQYQY